MDFTICEMHSYTFYSEYNFLKRKKPGVRLTFDVDFDWHWNSYQTSSLFHTDVSCEHAITCPWMNAKRTNRCIIFTSWASNVAEPQLDIELSNQQCSLMSLHHDPSHKQKNLVNSWRSALCFISNRNSFGTFNKLYKRIAKVLCYIIVSLSVLSGGTLLDAIFKWAKYDSLDCCSVPMWRSNICVSA